MILLLYLTSKHLIQLSTKFIFRPSNTSASLYYTHFIGIPPPLLASSSIGIWSLLYASTTHINSYLSLRPVLKFSSNLWPFNFFKLLHYAIERFPLIYWLVYSFQTWCDFFSWWPTIIQHTETPYGKKSSGNTISFLILQLLCHSSVTNVPFNADHVCMELFTVPNSYQKHVKHFQWLTNKFFYFPFHENLRVPKFLEIGTTQFHQVSISANGLYSYLFISYLVHIRFQLFNNVWLINVFNRASCILLKHFFKDIILIIVVCRCEFIQKSSTEINLLQGICKRYCRLLYNHYQT